MRNSWKSVFDHLYNSGANSFTICVLIQTFNKDKLTPQDQVSTHRPTAVSRRGDELLLTPDPSLHQRYGTLPRNVQGP